MMQDGRKCSSAALLVPDTVPTQSSNLLRPSTRIGLSTMKQGLKEGVTARCCCHLIIIQKLGSQAAQAGMSHVHRLQGCSQCSVLALAQSQGPVRTCLTWRQLRCLQWDEDTHACCCMLKQADRGQPSSEPLQDA